MGETGAPRPSAISISEKYSGAPNLSATSASGGPTSAISSVPTQPAKNEPIAAIASAGPHAPGGPSVAVETGHDRRGFARQVDQDGRGGAAVLRAVIDAGQHDERRNRRQVEGERQQHRDRDQRADARQHADHRADEHAEKQYIRFWSESATEEPEDEIVEDVHVSTMPGRVDKAVRAHRRTRRPQTRS